MCKTTKFSEGARGRGAVVVEAARRAGPGCGSGAVRLQPLRAIHFRLVIDEASYRDPSQLPYLPSPFKHFPASCLMPTPPCPIDVYNWLTTRSSIQKKISHYLFLFFLRLFTICSDHRFFFVFFVRIFF